MDRNKCRKCGKNRLSKFFSKCTNKPNGLWIYCKDCDNKRNIEWYQKPGKAEHSIAKMTEYRKTEKGRESSKRAIKKHRSSDKWKKYLKSKMKKNPEKYRAHWLVKSAIKRGILKRKPCQKCGKRKYVHAHHDNYFKPLDVAWLCAQHHSARHKELGWGTTSK